MAAEVMTSTPTGCGDRAGGIEERASSGSTAGPAAQREGPRSALFPDDDYGGGGPAPSDDDDDDGRGSSSSHPATLSPVTSPPYWTHAQSHVFSPTGGGGSNGGPRLGIGGGGGGGTHGRSSFSSGGGGVGGGFANNHSTESVVPAGAITLQDNESGPDEDADGGGGGGGGPERLSGRDRNRACWAKSVSVADYVIVNGSATNIGAFVVWNIRVETLSGSYMNIRKRYSEFDDLRQKLIMTFPTFEAAVPVLPPKSVISKFRPRFLEKRRSGLQYFLNCILLNPEFSGSPVLKDFLFS